MVVLQGVLLLAMAAGGQADAAGHSKTAGQAGVPVQSQAGGMAGHVVVGVGPGVESIVSMRNNQPFDGAASRRQSYDLKVTSTDWVDTGIMVRAGEQASITATGSFVLMDGREAGPDGLARGWKDLLRQFPLNSAPVGALVGRVSDMGASVPFLIGSKTEAMLPTSGRLFLRVNLSSDVTATGSYAVKLKFSAAAMGPQGNSREISELLRVDLFANIPRRVTDQSGNAGDMVNFALVGTEAQVSAAFRVAGWVAVDKTVEDAVLHGLLSTLSHEAYTEMPMSTLYLFGRAQDLSFARGDPLMVAAERHHLRVWKTRELVDGRPLWVGSCTHDIGFEKDQRNNGVTHRIDPDIDKEREFLLQSFDAAGVFSSAAYVSPTEPLMSAKTATGGTFHSDGRIVVMEIK